jgi:hypothetical protein
MKSFQDVIKKSFPRCRFIQDARTPEKLVIVTANFLFIFLTLGGLGPSHGF